MYDFLLYNVFTPNIPKTKILGQLQTPRVRNSEDGSTCDLFIFSTDP